MDLVRTVYYLYWDTNLKGMEQPSESDGNVGLDTDRRDKNKGDKFFIRMSINEDHEMVMVSTKTFSKNEEGVTGAVLAGDEVQLFWHRTWSQQQEHKEFLRRRGLRSSRRCLEARRNQNPNKNPGCVQYVE